MPKRRSPPRVAAWVRSSGSRSFWLHRHQELGLKRASPLPGSICLNSHSPASPARVGVWRMPWLSARVAAALRMSGSAPATRKISIVRTLLPRPRGWMEVPACRSTRVCRTPSRPRKTDIDRPTRDPPTTRTGTRWVRSPPGAPPDRSALSFMVARPPLRQTWVTDVRDRPVGHTCGTDPRDGTRPATDAPPRPLCVRDGRAPRPVCAGVFMHAPYGPSRPAAAQASPA